jgi:uncharacterized protein (TIGR03663 family)
MTGGDQGLSENRGHSEAARQTWAADHWWNLAAIILVVAAVLRLYDLELKPLHHDEGVNGLILNDLLNSPHVYRYNPTNFHGPTLYYFAWLSISVVGVTTFAIRLVTAMFGVGTVALLLNTRNSIGPTAALIAAALVACSPAAVYYSRYFIHEVLLGFFTVGTVLAVLSYKQTRRVSRLVLGSASAALMFATKETALISAVVLCASAAVTWLYMRLRQDTRASPIATTRGTDPAGAADKQPGWLRFSRPLWLGIVACAIFLAVNGLFYSSFLTNSQGVPAALKAFAPWASTGVHSHTHPWTTYLSWLFQEESPVLFLGAAGLAFALWRADNELAVFSALWALGTVIAYSAIPYKTPWLTLNMVLPLAITAGYAVELATGSSGTVARRAAPAVTVAALALALYQTVVLNFFRYDDDRYAYVYAHTNRKALELVREIDRLMEARRDGKSVTVAISSPDYFPLTWYFRSYPVGYYGRVESFTDPIVIGSDEQDATLRAGLGADFERLGSYPLRPGVVLVLYVRGDLLSIH